MKVLLSIVMVASLAMSAIADVDYSGRYRSDDGRTYFVTHNRGNNYITWFSDRYEGGDRFINVFHGFVDKDGVISGSWSNVPFDKDNTKSFSRGDVKLRFNNGRIEFLSGPSNFRWRAWSRNNNN